MQCSEVLSEITEKAEFIKQLFNSDDVKDYQKLSMKTNIEEAFFNPKVQDLLDLPNDIMKEKVQSLPHTEASLLLQQCILCLNLTKRLFEILKNVDSASFAVSALRSVYKILSIY